jgi:hypothetical protein
MERLDGHVDHAEKIQSELILAVRALVALVVTVAIAVFGVLWLAVTGG